MDRQAVLAALRANPKYQERLRGALEQLDQEIVLRFEGYDERVRVEVSFQSPQGRGPFTPWATVPCDALPKGFNSIKNWLVNSGIFSGARWLPCLREEVAAVFGADVRFDTFCLVFSDDIAASPRWEPIVNNIITEYERC